MAREPIFKPGGLIIVGSFAATFVILATARLLGWQSSVLGTLGVLIATHVVSGVARVILVWREAREAGSAAREEARLYQESHPDPFGENEPLGPLPWPSRPREPE